MAADPAAAVFAGALPGPPDHDMDGAVAAEAANRVQAGAAADGITTATAVAPEPPQQPDNPLLTQLNELWVAVKGQDADDLTTWTSLVSTAEKLNDLQQMRAAFDAFLAQYPLCYGYWKKYAEAERRQGSSSGDADGAGSGAAAAAATAAAGSSAAAQQAAAAVYQRAVAAVPHSTELWVAYAALLQASDAPTDTVRSVYDAAAAAAGGDYTSGLLWDKFLAYEAALGSPSSVAALYARVLACPVKDLDKYHMGLTNYASSRTAAELLPEDTVAALKAQLEEQAAVAAAAAAAAAQQQQAAESAEQTDQAAAAQEDAAAAGAEAGTAEATAAAADDGAGSSKAEAGRDVEMPDAAPPAADADAAAAEGAPAQPSSTDPDAAAAAAAPAVVDDAAVKAAWMAEQHSVYQATKQQLAAIQGFEAGIRRPYWHYKPLDGQQLQNWLAYLDWQQRQGDAAAVQRLFERCLVPCANYPEFWMRYVCWCQAQASSSTDGTADSSSSSIPSSDAAAAVLARALGTFCRRNAKLVLFAARFFEGHGDSGAARAQYTRLLGDVAPGLFEGVVAFANFEHRASGPQAAKAVYEQALASSQQQDQQKDSSSSKRRSSGSGGGSSSSSRGFLYVLYANFLRQVLGDLEAARAMLSQGLEQRPACRELWDAALWAEETLPGPDRVERVLSLYAQLLQPKADAAAKQQQQQQPTQPDAAAAEAPPANGSAAAVNGSLETPQTAESTDAPAEATNGPAAAGDAAAAAAGDAAAAADASSSLPDDVLEEFSQRCVEFADMHADLKTLQQVQDRHMQLFPLPAAALAAARPRQRDTAAATAAAGGSYAATAAAGAAGAANGYASAGTGVDAAAAAAAAAAMDPAAAYGYYPPAGPGGYYLPSHHYPSHGGYPPAHHYGPPAHHWGYGYGAGHY